MFELKYKIFKENIIPIEFDEFYGEEGYVSVKMNGNTYGDLEEKEIFILSVSIYLTFRYLLEAIKFLKLENRREVFISDIESYIVWYRIGIVNDSYIEVSKVMFDKKNGPSRAIEPVLEKYKTEWEEKVLIDCFLDEIVKKSTEYLKDLHSLNDLENRDISELEELIQEVSKYSSINFFEK